MLLRCKLHPAHVILPSQHRRRTERAQPAFRVFTTVTTSFSPKDTTGTRDAPVASATFTNPFLHACEPARHLPGSSADFSWSPACEKRMSASNRSLHVCYKRNGNTGRRTSCSGRCRTCPAMRAAPPALRRSLAAPPDLAPAAAASVSFHPTGVLHPSCTYSCRQGTPPYAEFSQLIRPYLQYPAQRGRARVHKAQEQHQLARYRGAEVPQKGGCEARRALAHVG